MALLEIRSYVLDNRRPRSGVNMASHHHKARGSPLGMPSARSQKTSLLRGVESVPLAVGVAVHFEIVIPKHLVAVLQGEKSVQPQHEIMRSRKLT